MSKLSHTEEEPLARAAVDEVLVRDAEHLHDASKLFLLVLTREDREAGVELSHDTPETPHVDRHMIVHAEYDLW